MTAARHRAAPRRFAGQTGRRWSTFVLVALCGLVPAAGGCDAGTEPARPFENAAAARPFEDTTPAQLFEDARARVPATAADAPRIVAFGNSLTAGLGVAPDQAYPAHLQRQLDAAGYRYAVVNAGVSGETTAGGLRRLPWILKSRPSLVILELGANDALRGQPLSAIESNLRAIIEGLREGGAVVVLAGMKIPPNYGADYTTGFAALFARVAREQAVTLIPFFLEDVAAQADLNQADGIHPTGDGYRLVAGTVFDVIEPLLTKDRAARDEPPPRRAPASREHGREMEHPAGEGHRF